MCSQTVGLVGAELERQGIATVAIQLLREVAGKGRPPAPAPPGGPMCTRPVGRGGAELERQGIATVAIQLLREIAEKVRPPRSLWVPLPPGYPPAPPPPPARPPPAL